ncbi:PadR family transcriptional regulator [Candidatus Bathyarchaeota archaeon]|nr:PadR family transcriptional regulator [Candidatus Bathyarchaeota archaeon]
MHSEEEASVDWLKETQKGYIRIVVLILLSKKPYHGYEIMKQVRERTMGLWKPTAGGIYPRLRDLEESGYIVGEWDVQKLRKRKIYKITKTGKSVLEKALVKESQLATSMSGLFKDYVNNVLGVKVGLVQIPRVPNLLSAFLEEGKEKPEDTVNVLKSKRNQLETMSKELQRNLEAINARLARLENSKIRKEQQERARVKWDFV